MATDSGCLPAKCVQCRAELISPIVCEGCRSLYPSPPWADYFSLLGLPRTYAIDEKKLHAAFRAIARGIHPDRFAAASEDVRALATTLSAEVNQAYSVLSDPVRRADYWLELAGGPTAAEMRDVSSELLSDVLMLREAIDEARTAGDHDAMRRYRESVATRRHETIRLIFSIAESSADLDESKRKELRRLLNSIKYFDNLLKELADDPLAVQSSEPRPVGRADVRAG